MNIQLEQNHILRSIPVDFSIEEFTDFLQQARGGEKILDRALEVYKEQDTSWRSAAVFCPMRVKAITATHVVLENIERAEQVKLAMGWSGRFLQGAEYVLSGAYTTGHRLATDAAGATTSHHYLDAYILGQLDLALLGKTGEVVNSMIESIAAANSMGIGPLLSPGSVHGWDLMDQQVLCSHLSLSEIGITCGSGCVLSPFNSLTFVIGIGRGYTATKVGSPCEVCANKEKCELRQQAS